MTWWRQITWAGRGLPACCQRLSHSSPWAFAPAFARSVWLFLRPSPCVALLACAPLCIGASLLSSVAGRVPETWLTGRDPGVWEREEGAREAWRFCPVSRGPRIRHRVAADQGPGVLSYCIAAKPACPRGFARWSMVVQVEWRPWGAPCFAVLPLEGTCLSWRGGLNTPGRSPFRLGVGPAGESGDWSLLPQILTSSKGPWRPEVPWSPAWKAVGRRLPGGC